MGLVWSKTQLRCSSLFRMHGMNSHKSFVTLVSEAQVSSSVESYASSSICVLFKGKCSRSRRTTVKDPRIYGQMGNYGLVFAPKQGKVIQQFGRQRGDSSHLIIDESNDLFIDLSSPLLLRLPALSENQARRKTTAGTASPSDGRREPYIKWAWLHPSSNA